jgi:hypothetical protein
VDLLPPPKAKGKGEGALPAEEERQWHRIRTPIALAHHISFYEVKTEVK